MEYFYTYQANTGTVFYSNIMPEITDDLFYLGKGKEHERPAAVAARLMSRQFPDVQGIHLVSQVM